MLHRPTPPTSATATTATTAAIPRVCLSLLTAVCLACPPGVVKAAEPAVDKPATTEPAATEPATAEPNTAEVESATATEPNAEPNAGPNTEPNTEPAPQTVPLYLNPASTPAPVAEAAAMDFDTAREAAGIPKWSGTGLLSAGITTTIAGVLLSLTYLVNTPGRGARYDYDSESGNAYYPETPIYLAVGLTVLAGGAAMVSVGGVRQRRYQAAVLDSLVRGRVSTTRGEPSSFTPISSGAPPPTGRGALGSGIALTSAGMISLLTLLSVRMADVGYGVPDENGSLALIFAGPIIAATLPAGIALTAVGAMRRDRHQLWLRSHDEALGPPPPSISLHGGTAAPMSIRPGVAYGRPVRTYGFQLRF